MSVSTELMKVATRAEFDAIIQRRRAARMTRIDAMPPELRACVHEYGFTVVSACLDLGVKQPKHIRHLVETIINEFSPTRGSYSAQGRKGDGEGVDGGKMKRRDQDHRFE